MVTNRLIWPMVNLELPNFTRTSTPIDSIALVDMTSPAILPVGSYHGGTTENAVSDGFEWCGVFPDPTGLLSLIIRPYLVVQTKSDCSLMILQTA